MLPIALTCGDPAGIGPEVAVKALAAEAATLTASRVTCVLIGDRRQLASLPWPADLPAPAILDPRPEPLPPHLAPRSPAAALAALDYLRRGAQGCLQGEFAGLVTAPVCKESIHRTGTPFTGQTEFLADLAGTPEVTMMLLGEDDRGRWLRVALATTHLPLRLVAGTLTPAAIHRAIRHTAGACRRLGLPSARLAVCGLNPHAGEGGVLGDEEDRILRPALDLAREEGCDVEGPCPGDTVFHAALHGRYDAVIAMYHDQGLAPLKTVAFDTGVNWTLGLPFPRTSPDHGTAYDLAGRGTARPTSMQAALRLAIRLARATPASPAISAEAS